MTLKIGSLDIPQVAVLAPMAGMTDVCFRLLCKEQACGLVYTELVRADLLLQESNRSLRLCETTDAEHPVGVQLYHHEPTVLAEAARWVTDNVACDLIDLNMGCPVPKVVTKGAGAALMRQPKLVERLVRAVVEATPLPVTVKTRSGWTEAEQNAVEISRAAEAAGAAAITIHARSRSQRHDGPVDWALLAEVKRSVSIPVIGNGGITDPESALAMRESAGVDAVMVGRGALGNPWVFGRIDAAWNGRPCPPLALQDRIALIRRHVEACVGANLRWARRGRDTGSAEIRAMRYVRGHLIGYVKGAPGEAPFRQRLATLDTIEDVMDAVELAWTAPPSDRTGPTKTNSSAAA